MGRSVSFDRAILLASNGQPVASWTVQPTVLLALLTAAVNSLLHFALREGVTVIWWRKAMTEGTTIDDLHHVWEFGTSILAATFAGRQFNRVALASILTTLVVIDAPLLQRASSITSRSVTIPVTMSANLATSIPTTSFVTGGAYVSVLDPLFARVMQDYGNRVPIDAVSGCHGTCFLTVKAFGFSTQCNTDTTPIFVPQCTDTPISPRYANFTLFETNVGINSGSVSFPDSIFLNISYASFGRGGGNLTTSICTLRPAIIKYPLMSNNGTVQLQPSTSNYTGRVKNEVLDISTHSPGAYILGGIQLSVDNTFRSLATTRHAGSCIWNYTSEGSLASRYIYENDTYNVATSPEISFRDPTPDILTSINEIMFRFALAAANSSSKQTVPATQTSEQNTYESHFRYLGGALVIMLLGIFAVTPLFYGYWHIGRSITMSPVETAKSFDAPLLKGSGSNAKVEKLLKAVGKRK
ncbi:MAG: hypothetical protein M1835_000840, partial [Candelina submexicana]